MPPCSPVPGFVAPSNNVKSLAEYAVQVDKVQFREKALSLTSFYEVVTTELDSGAAAGAYDCLSEEDRRFCETWVYLARLEYFDKATKKVKDKELRAAIQRHLDGQTGPDIGPISG